VDIVNKYQSTSEFFWLFERFSFAYTEEFKRQGRKGGRRKERRELFASSSFAPFAFKRSLSQYTQWKFALSKSSSVAV
jgi:hypothetical protein